MGVLAVDGGQSAVRLRHSDAAADVEVPGVSRLEGDTVASVAAAVTAGWQRAGALSTERVMLGLTTAPTDSGSRERLAKEVAGGVGAAEIWLADDAVTGHVGALSQGWGVSVVAGTGVACMAAGPSGPPRIIGGHGYLIGDEGGGFWIGSAGIRAVLKADDGRGPETAMREPAGRHFGGLRDLGDRLHSSPRPVDTIARFAPSVIEAASDGDPVASSIVDAAADELLALVRAALAGLDPAARPVPLALGGRLLLEGLLRDRVEAAVRTALPAYAVHSAAGTPLDGAMRLAGSADPGPYAEYVFVWERTR